MAFFKFIRLCPFPVFWRGGKEGFFMKCQLCPIVSREEISGDILSLRVLCPEISAEAVPGQFAHIGVPGFSLRRPISLCEIDREKGELRLVLQARGEGTRALFALKEGDSLDLLAPLGHGFTLLSKESHAAVVGGGIGVPPLYELARYYGNNCNAILGFRCQQQMLLDTDFAACCDTIVCTDDGSWGVPGTVLPAVEALLQGCRLDILYACGPKPMLQAVRDLAVFYGVRCELSLEERMACGVGACLGCAVRIRREGQEEYLHVCKDGPVFNGADVVF